MLWTRTLIPTMKETPEGAEIPSHVLMLRAGLVNQVMAGAYTYLPLGLRALRKAERIVREEMDAAGAVELAMPAMSPRGLWEQTGRVAAFGDVLVQLTLNRPGRKVHVVLGPTHEEIVTDLVSRQISSYRQMPITLYQITSKFRNEERPRFGVLRTSEFLMKDAYSFDASLESLNESYEKMYAAYCRIFTRCGLNYLAVEAESGPIGGDASHEFMIPADNGEDTVLHCRRAAMRPTRRRPRSARAISRRPQVAACSRSNECPRPGVSTIEQVSAFLKCRPQDLIKTLIYVADGQPIAVLVRGDHEANEGKIRRAAERPAKARTGPAGSDRASDRRAGRVRRAGADEGEDSDPGRPRRAEASSTRVTGANAADAHLTGVNLHRDFEPDLFADLRKAIDGDPCPRCSATLALRHAIEVGHVFKLGTKYTEALDAKFLDADEQLKPIIMGCYGIGVNRIIAGLIETSNDKDGIIWPMSLAPYEVLLAPVKVPDEASMKVAHGVARPTHGRRRSTCCWTTAIAAPA